MIYLRPELFYKNYNTPKSIMTKLVSHVPEGPLEQKWISHKNNIRIVSPANKRKLEIIVVGTGLGGASAAASLGELGYNVKVFCISDSPRRAHSIAAQGGINAAKNYRNDNDSVYRLFHDTIKSGDYRSREANVYRLAEVSNNIIDHCVAQGVPFGRDYSGLLDNRSFGGGQVSRTFYARGQTGQQLLLGAYAALNRQVAKGRVKTYPRHEMLDLVVIDDEAKGIIARNLVTGKIERFGAHAVVIATGGYGNCYFLSTYAMTCNGSAIWQCYKKGAFFANPGFAQIHPTCIPVEGDQQSKLTLMSESLRNDGRIWVPKKIEDAKKLQTGEIKGSQIPEEDRDYYLERRYPAFGNLVPRDVASRAAKERCDAGFGVNNTGRGVFLDFSTAIERLGKEVIEARYGNLFQMYEKITAVNAYEEPMMIYPAIHYTMGGIWVDYNLQTTIPGLYAIGEANFSDHGGNRLGASALMQGLADGYFILPYTIGDYLGGKILTPKTDTNHPAFAEAEKAITDKINKLFNVKGKRSVDSFHKELGHIMWEYVGMTRNEEGLNKAITEIRKLRKEYWQNVSVPGENNEFNQELEKALRVADFMEMGELMALDALNRRESCGGHFREEMQTEDGETKRDDDNFMYVSAWEYQGDDLEPALHKEELIFEFVKVASRSYAKI
jgi:succinate dehydrogenase / fumarate reductase flavoprotein subunit